MSDYLFQFVGNFESLALDSSEEALRKLVESLEIRENGTYEKHIVPYLACCALLYKGVPGVEALSSALPKAPGFIYPLAILTALWRASEGEQVRPTFGALPQGSPLSCPLPETTRTAARVKFVSFLDECRTDSESFYRLINLLYQEQMRSMFDKESHERFYQSVFRILSDSTLRLSDRHIDQYKELLAAGDREESYQAFLTNNPVFLDPLASRLISKHKLGAEFITDYVLERITGDYLAIEIEKPSDPIFTQANDFSAQFSHAFGQVLDFIEWIEQNVSYAQKKLPGISSPKGLLIIGLRQRLTAAQIDKLRRFCKNSSSVHVLTFDDLLTNAESLLRNIRHRAEFWSETERHGDV
ncbi:MAG: DUF4263 domain-containing protein [Desulfobulbaceae bacterium]|nr:DUF4263 domain-containing protein [Desulfobulbaceae bacterium]